MDSNPDAGVGVSKAVGVAPAHKLFAACTAIAILALGVWFALGVRHVERGGTRQARPVAGTIADAAAEWQPRPGYVGSAACRKCHEEQYASYQQTMHSRSLSEIRPEEEPADAVFDHPESGYRFRTSHAAGRMVHEAILLLPDGGELGRARHELTHRVGSGHVSRTYLAVASNGLFIESPITWWESWQRWGMSPGYDLPRHQVFNRVVEDGCLICHAGNIETTSANDFRVRLVELAIGCERCHGPAQTHVDRETAGLAAAEGAGRSIVHPGRLPRALAEAICQQCHKQGDFQLPVRGTHPTLFRPGEPLIAYRHDYRIRKPRTVMEIVEHSEQLAHSACYRQSESLTCTTCHNPHVIIAPEDRAAHYRAVCLKCHDEAACREPLESRTARCENNCAECHMPSQETTMPHVAFTHHQIGVHPVKSEPGNPEPVAPGTLDRLVPLFDLESLPASDRRRTLGLAWEQLAVIDFADVNDDLRWRASAERAEELLTALPAEFVDVPVLAALSELYYLRKDLPRAAELGLEVLRNESAGPREKIKVLLPLGTAAASEGRFSEAADHFSQMARLRCNADDWYFLGRCEHKLQRDDAAISALTTALQLNLSSVPIRLLLAEIYHSRGEFDAEKRLRDEIEKLSASMPPR